MKENKNNLFDELHSLPFADYVVLCFGGEYPYAKVYTTDYGDIEMPLDIIEDGTYIEYYNSVIGERAKALYGYYNGIAEAFKRHI